MNRGDYVKMAGRAMSTSSRRVCIVQPQSLPAQADVSSRIAVHLRLALSTVGMTTICARAAGAFRMRRLCWRYPS